MLESIATQTRVADVCRIVVQFDRPVDTALRAELAAKGLRLLNYLGEHAFFAALSVRDSDAPALARIPALVGVESIQVEWKLHPVFLDGVIPPWSQVDVDSVGTPIVGAYLMFHPDSDLNEGIALLENYGVDVRSVLESINGLVIELPVDMIPFVAAEDAVQWIEPPLPPLEPVNAENRAVTGADVAQAAPYGLDGSGVTVLVYDAGTARATHVDFEGRATVYDSSGMHYHATHVAGTIGGAGIANSAYKGMAPGVTILSYGFEQEGGLQEGFLYTDPGDIEDDYSEAISTYGAAISNNSIGTNTASNGFPCEWEGNYGATGVLIDTIVRGDGSNPLFAEPFRIVWANGNERSSGACGTTYNTTAPPACAKNHITVGALDEDESISYYTSWGPADDDRMKPDLSSVGSNVDSCDSGSDTAYTNLSGTSMASPTVCGCSALLLQDYRAQFPGEPDFRNSTLKTLLAHTAVDLGNAGPDYQFGYGSIRIPAAVDFMRTENFFEAEVASGASYSVLVVVEPGDPELKVTLAWDDYPGTPNVNPVLVNDLDLRVYSPSAIRHYPWTLGGLANPSAPAVQTQENHVDNIEQVLVDSPEVGVWTVEVYGYNVPQGPQVFSLGASPLLVACSSAGIITLDAALYPCSDTTQIKVVDCDLNTDDNTVETVVVTIESDSEPAGESVLLTETGAATADFRNTIQINEIDSAGVLQVADGDTITATYIDADDGQGGTNVVVVATATVDCVPPLISNIQLTDLQARSAKVAFDTDESARGTVYYGLSCATLTESTSAGGYVTTREISLSGLQDNQTYYYMVEAEDRAGNISTDDNGGVCYSFTTPEVPDFFTELFESSDNDLDNLTLFFSPDSGNDFYAACAEPAVALPSDPSGGNSLSFSPNDDDGYDTVSVGGGEQVYLYGVGYSSFYVSTNGYITFNSGDTDTGESFTDHFEQPRISVLFDDLDPGAGGSATWKQFADRVAVTFENVPEYSVGGANTFQIELFFDGRITITYLAISASDGLAGLSEGNGQDPEFLETDLSNLGNCGPKPPTASGQNMEIPANLPVAIMLQASDDGLPDPPGTITYIITSLPQHGDLTDFGTSHVIVPADLPYSISAGGNVVEYDPVQFYAGPDSFQFKANDSGTPPDGGDSNIATVSITVGVPGLVYSFPLDQNPGWSGGGDWAFGTPTGGGGEHGYPDPTSGHTGDYVYGYNLSGDYSAGMSETDLTSTTIDCTNVTDVSVKFWRWLGVERPAYDHAYFRVSNDGLGWNTIWENSAEVADSSWTQVEYDISGVADGQPTLYLRWTMGVTDASWFYCGWNIDDIEIHGLVSGPPVYTTGDLNCDGTVNSLDIDPFVLVLTNAPDFDDYYAQYPDCDVTLADCNDDGSYNSLDIDAFVSLLSE